MCGVSSDGPVELDARVANNRVVDPYPDAIKQKAFHGKSGGVGCEAMSVW